MEKAIDASQKIEMLKDIVSKGKPKNVLNWLLKNSNENLKENLIDENEDHSNNSDWLEDKEEKEEATQWYSDTLKNVFNENLNNFKRARELYQSVFSSTDKKGYFYKLNEKVSHGQKYAENFMKIWEEIKKDVSQGEAVLTKYSSDSDSMKKKIAEKLRLISFLELVNGIKSQSIPHEEATPVLNKYIESVKEIIVNLSKQVYFGEMQKRGTELENDGSVYKPGVCHSWGVNLSWLLAHFKKGTIFTVISDIPSNKIRKSSHTSSEYSAFLREVCACLKANYILNYDGKQTILSPSKNWNPAKCFSNGLKGNGVNPADEEIERIYKNLAERYESKNEFTYSMDENLKLLGSEVKFAKLRVCKCLEPDFSLLYGSFNFKTERISR